jgi:serine/threonine protein phosphatase PrpC
VEVFIAQTKKKYKPALGAAYRRNIRWGVAILMFHEQEDDDMGKIVENQLKDKQITIPKNGKVNEEYSYKLDIGSWGIPEIAEVVNFNGLDTIGLEYLSEEKLIKGKPTQAGDHMIEMEYKRKDWEEGRPLLPLKVTFIINPDPKSLWKNLPTPKDIEYYKPDNDKKIVKVASKKAKGKKEIARRDMVMVAASQRGRSHANEGKPRDDDFALDFDEKTKWYVMVVADGAGSAQFSRRGSQIACQTAIEVCKTQITELGNLLENQIRFYRSKKTGERKDTYKFLEKIVGIYLDEIVGKAGLEAYNKVKEEAVSKERKPKEYATTFLLSICKKFDFGWFVGAFWVGDGGIGIYRKQVKDVKILGEPDGGEFAGQTRFLTMREIFEDRPRTRFEIVEDFTALILMTDGVTDPKFETDANLRRIEKWNALWDDLNGNNEDELKVDFTAYNEQIDDQLLKWLDFWSKGNHDDRTIAILF